MKIIIGLGNPGEKYGGTRHNIGFEILDRLKEVWGFSDSEFSKKFNAEISKGTLDGKEIILAKPQTFMNLSGEAVAKILEFYKLTADDIIVVHDDLDIVLGKYKIATDSSSAGHNGVQNIVEKIGTQKFKRVRIGIGEEMNGTAVCRTNAHDFVLGKFSEEDAEKIYPLLSQIIKDVLPSLL